MHPSFARLLPATVGPLVLPTLFAAALLGALGGAAQAQAPGVPIEAEKGTNLNVRTKAAKLIEDGKMVDAERIKKMLAKPVPEVVELPAAKKQVLGRGDIYEFARQSRVHVGWHYLCHKCSNWHSQLAGGYPITADGVIVTCHHVAEPKADMKEGYLIVVDDAGAVTPVTSVIADSAELDITVLRATGGKFSPVPLNDKVRPGDAAYCLSDPMGVTGYFSAGIVNRFYRKADGRGSSADALRLHVSTDWAPGSSGSPVLDECGNVIGHVSTISTIGSAKTKEEQAKTGTQIVLHEASPANGTLRLVAAAAELARKAAAEPAPKVEPAAEPVKPSEPVEPAAKPAEPQQEPKASVEPETVSALP